MDRYQFGRTLLNGVFVLIATAGVTRCQPDSASDANGNTKAAQACETDKNAAAVASLLAATRLDLKATQDAVVKLMKMSGVKGSLADVETNLAQWLEDAGTESIASFDAWRRKVSAIADNKPFTEVPDALQAFKDAASGESKGGGEAAAGLATANATLAALKGVSGIDAAETQAQIQRLKTLTVGADGEQTLVDAVDSVLAARDGLKAEVDTLPLAVAAVDDRLSAAGDTIAEQIDAVLAEASHGTAQSSAAITAIETAAGVGTNGTVTAINALKTTTGLSSLAAINTAVAALTTASGGDLAATSTAIGTLKTTTGLGSLSAIGTATSSLLAASGASLADTTTAISSLKTVTGGSTLPAAATAAVAARDALISSGTTLDAAVTAVNTSLGGTGTTNARATQALDLLLVSTSSSTGPSAAALGDVASAASVNARLAAYLSMFKSDSRADASRNGYQLQLNASAPTTFAELAGLLVPRNFATENKIVNGGTGVGVFSHSAYSSGEATLTFFSSATSNMNIVSFVVNAVTYSYELTSSISNNALFAFTSGAESFVFQNKSGSMINNTSSLTTLLADAFPPGAQVKLNSPVCR